MIFSYFISFNFNITIKSALKNYKLFSKVVIIIIQ